MTKINVERFDKKTHRFVIEEVEVGEKTRDIIYGAIVVAKKNWKEEKEAEEKRNYWGIRIILIIIGVLIFFLGSSEGERNERARVVDDVKYYCEQWDCK